MKLRASLIVALACAIGFAETHYDPIDPLRGVAPQPTGPTLSQLLSACFSGQPLPVRAIPRPTPVLPTMAAPILPVPTSPPSNSPVKKVDLDCKSAKGQAIRVDVDNKVADIVLQSGASPEELGKCDLTAGFTKTLTCESAGRRLFITGDALARGVLTLDGVEDQVTCQKKF